MWRERKNGRVGFHVDGGEEKEELWEKEQRVEEKRVERERELEQEQDTRRLEKEGDEIKEQLVKHEEKEGEPGEK